jgi:thymidylate synthase ThyX
MGNQAKVICDSVSPDGVRLTTMYTRHHRMIHAELLRHRMFSFSVSSSRAIPTKKMIDEVRDNPALPVWWGKNQKGMQAYEELDGADLILARDVWNRIRFEAIEAAKDLLALNAHKQLVNRLLEPWQWVDCIITATEWDNFFALRRHKDAQPEIKALADTMSDAMSSSTPKKLDYGEWHLPYVTSVDSQNMFGGLLTMTKQDEILHKASAARCARVSYRNHDGTECDLVKDVELANSLLSSFHMSPFEHQARPMLPGLDLDCDKPVDENPTRCFCGNLRGFVSYRKTIPDEAIANLTNGDTQ